MKNLTILLGILATMLFACKKVSNSGSILVINQDSLVALSEAGYRPVYHFTPPQHWMNDPNGLVYYQGKYHLFYQYNPNSNVWGPMNWGHATSTDLFNWQDNAIALSPDNAGAIFSGSAVVDVNNTTGFKANANDPLVAVYTIAGTQQQQGIAYSTDGGISWAKYANNPVLPNGGMADFRDPKVFWSALADKWVMALATGNKISFYSSANLKNWVLESSFGENEGAHGGVWECPDIFELPVDGSATKKWVLLVSCNGGPNGGTATQYFVGNFDGKTFTTETHNTKWVDYGTDNYAGVTYNDLPNTDGRRITIGWMSNWAYAQQVPTTTWRSTMTVPRTFSLSNTAQGYVLKSMPVVEINNYLSSIDDTAVSTPVKSLRIDNNTVIKTGSYEIDFTADLNTTSNLQLTLGNSSEKLVISYDKAAGQLMVNRGSSGLVDFNNQFANPIICPLIPPTGGITDFKILVDKTSVELFADNGTRVVTALFFPIYQYNFLKLAGDGTSAVINSFTLKSINKSIAR